MDATPRQVELFHKLTTDRQFPDGTNLDTIRATFATLDSRSASGWIERAMTFPRITEDGDATPVVPPAF